MSLINESQEMLGQAVGRYLSDNYDFESRTKALSQGLWPEALWQGFAEELGILGLPFPETHNGLGLGALDTMVVMQALGRNLAAEPFLSSVVGVGALTVALPADEAAALQPLVDAVISGTARVGLAISDALGDPGPGNRQLSADRLTGSIPIVAAASSATHFIVSAATPDGETALVLVERSAAGCESRPVPTIDGNTALALEFDVARSDATVVAVSADAAIEWAHDALHAALAAEIVGIVDALIEITVEFAKQRVQFSKPIAQFQVIQHRLADMYVEGELARSMAMLAAIKMDAPRTERRAAIAAAVARAGMAGRKVGEGAIQIHGGIGTTDELIVGHYFKRLLAIEALFGRTYGHVERYARYRTDLGQPIPVV